MNWTLGDFGRAGVTVAMLLGAVAYIEHRRASGKLPQGGYSFRGVWQVVGAFSLVAAVVSGIVYVKTGSLEHALGLGGIMLGVILFGSLRGFFSEYQLKKDGAKNLDKR